MPTLHDKWLIVSTIYIMGAITDSTSNHSPLAAAFLLTAPQPAMHAEGSVSLMHILLCRLHGLILRTALFRRPRGMGAGASATNTGGLALKGKNGNTHLPIDAFICPIAGDIMCDPVMTADGHT